MRKALVLLLGLLLSAAALWASPQAEEQSLKILGQVDESVTEYVLEQLAEEYPDVIVEFLQVDLSDGSTMTMDAMIAAGTPPDVYVDYMGRASKYIDPAFALDLSPYIDASEFIPGTLGPVTRDGAILGIPMPGGAQAMVINLKILDAIGESDFDFDNWTVDEFLMLAEKVKAETDAYATYLFAGNQSGDYLWFNWLASFGGRLYESGDYSETAIDSPAGLQFFTALGYLVREGLAPAESAVLTDDDYALEWAKGNVFAGAWFPAWVKPYFDAVTKQGLGGADFEYKFVEFPRAAGVDTVPCAGSMPGVVVHRSDSEAQNDLAAAAAVLFTDANSQLIVAGNMGGYPNRTAVDYTFTDPHWDAISKIVAENGMLDLGLAMPKFSEIRVQSVPFLQALYTGKATPAETLEGYVAAVNKVLAR